MLDLVQSLHLLQRDFGRRLTGFGVQQVRRSFGRCFDRSFGEAFKNGPPTVDASFDVHEGSVETMDGDGVIVDEIFNLLSERGSEPPQERDNKLRRCQCSPQRFPRMVVVHERGKSSGCEGDCDLMI